MRVTDNGNPVCTAVADGSGNWSCDATSPLSEGPHTLSVTATDPVGNASAPATRPFSVDTLPPGAPTVTAPTLNSLLNTATPAVTGQAEPNATVVVHQPSGGFQGQATDIFIHAQNMQRTKSLMIKLYAEHCGRTTEEVERALDRDNFMTAEQAAEWGLIDRVLHHRQPAENLL